MRRRTKVLTAILLVIIIGVVLPQRFYMPVDHATLADFNPESFWYHPWGKSGTHKGVDIFAKRGTGIHSSTAGIIVYRGHMARGGNVVLVLGPKWRLHYYAHLDQITASVGWTDGHDELGTVGSTGNAAGKPPHLHYSIVTLIPYFWQIDSSPEGWKKMFFLNPITYLPEAQH